MMTHPLSLSSPDQILMPGLHIPEQLNEIKTSI